MAGQNWVPQLDSALGAGCAAQLSIKPLDASGVAGAPLLTAMPGRWGDSMAPIGPDRRPRGHIGQLMELGVSPAGAAAPEGDPHHVPMWPPPAD